MSPQALWQTNAGGNDIHIYNIQNHQLIKHLKVGPEPHGIAYASKTDEVLVTLEKNASPFGELLWINPRDYKIVSRIKIGRKPQALAVTPDGKWIYVPCRDGYYWVIDGENKKVETKIYTGGLPHNTIISRDGNHAYLSPMGTPHKVSIIDIKNNHQYIATLPFSESLRPSAIDIKEHYFFQHVDKLNGFEVVSIPERQFIKRVQHQTGLGVFTTIGPLGWLSRYGLQRCHGLAIRPDQQEIWSTCGRVLNIHSLQPPFRQAHTIQLSGKGYWLTFSPDSKFAFIALKDKKKTVVIDTENKIKVSFYQAGIKPKRNIVIPFQ